MERRKNTRNVKDEETSLSAAVFLCMVNPTRERRSSISDDASFSNEVMPAGRSIHLFIIYLFIYNPNRSDNQLS